ncbi:hypothetical protein [Streptomyces coeruleorubidus]|uniref:hypothetical protein n=1 Tax=Streptomyces coeruleorubidus TaxID=116188 RepID=UPI0033A2BE44
MTWLAPDTYLTFCRGIPLADLTGFFSEAGLPAAGSGASEDGWAWLTHLARSTPDGGAVQQLGQYVTGFRYADRVSDQQNVDMVFLASTPACACDDGRRYAVPHCAEHPYQFAYSRGGFAVSLFNVGARRESRRFGSQADLFIRQFLEEGIVGRTTRYDADPDFNPDGTETVRIIAGHFGLPAAPLGPGRE